MLGIIITSILHVRKEFGKGYVTSPVMQWVGRKLPDGRYTATYQYTEWQVGHVLLHGKYLIGESHWIFLM